MIEPKETIVDKADHKMNKLERKLYNKVFNRFPIKDTDHYRKSTWKDLEDFFKEKFNVEYPLSESDSTSVIRQIKLKKLGV
jgi:hypothetical protein